MSTKKILFVDHAQALGGAENSLLLLVNNLDRDRWEPHIATNQGAFAEKAREANIPTHLLKLPRLRRSLTIGLDWWHYAKALANIAKEINAEFLHANTVRAAIYTSLGAKLAKRPFIWHMRDFWLSESKPRRLWLDKVGKRLLTSASTTIIANSKATALHLPSSTKIHTVHNGIDITRFDSTLESNSFRAQYKIPQNNPVVGMIGRLRPWKGQRSFLNMAAQVAKSHSDVHFLVVGGATFEVDDSYPQQLKSLSQDLNIADRVIFTGQINEIPRALAAMNIFVHPGDLEPFGLVNIEAMAMAKPIVAFNHGALPEIVEDGVTSMLVTPYDIDALATAVIRLIDNPQTQRTMGQNGRNRVKNHFTIQQTAKQITAIYDQIIDVSATSHNLSSFIG